VTQAKVNNCNIQNYVVAVTTNKTIRVRGMEEHTCSGSHSY